MMDCALCQVLAERYDLGVRYVVLIIIATALAVLQCSWLGAYPTAPNLLLALAAWAMVDGTEHGVIPRAWVIGTIADIFDPASIAFHALTFMTLAIIYLPIRSLIFRSRITGWAAWAFIATMLFHLCDGWMSGFGDGNGWYLFLSATWTALVAVAFGWLLKGLPDVLQPVGKGGA
jgi:hypothetical protein